jgi:hypothetical protein
MLRDIFTGHQTLNEAAVELPPGSIVDVANVSIRLVKPGALNQTLQTVVLAGIVLDIDHKAETILKRDILHLRVIQLVDKGIRHRSQAHFDQFVNGALISHDSYLL